MFGRSLIVFVALSCPVGAAEPQIARSRVIVNDSMFGRSIEEVIARLGYPDYVIPGDAKDSHGWASSAAELTSVLWLNEHCHPIVLDFNNSSGRSTGSDAGLGECREKGKPFRLRQPDARFRCPSRRFRRWCGR